ncbi:MAG: Modification methylase AplI [Nitrosomonadaceae bacterium]|nr:Modification methylase AplI [Nitrosomonadaceae bacterium]
MPKKFTSLEICAGAGGQAIGLERAGFEHIALVEFDADCCATLKLNRPNWDVFHQDVRTFSGKKYAGKVSLFAGGVPCPPFSVAGKQLGKNDDRDLFPEAIRLVKEIKPLAVMLENVRGLLNPSFESYRQSIEKDLRKLGYVAQWKLLSASDYGVSQLRPRVVLVAMKPDKMAKFTWPEPMKKASPTVGQLLIDLMKANGWEGANAWAEKANQIAPTLVGGSKKHGGPDLGPTRARNKWAELGVDGLGVANEAPTKGFTGNPKLTVRMAARTQGFPDKWAFSGKKTTSYRQVGNAFPPAVAEAVATRIAKALE